VSLSVKWLELAHTNDWPAWAMLCLPSLFTPLEGTTLVWKTYGELLGLRNTVEKHLCNGEVLVVRGLIRDQPLTVWRRLERARMAVPYVSRGAVEGAVRDEVAWLEREDPSLAQQLRVARERELRESSVVPESAVWS
jgi:hypothetical protein